MTEEDSIEIIPIAIAQGCIRSAIICINTSDDSVCVYKEMVIM